MYTTPYLAMHNPPPHYPQLARAWTVCCMNKSLLLALELTTPPSTRFYVRISVLKSTK